MHSLNQLQPLSRDLLLFFHAAEVGNLVRASENLSIQQSGLSKAIARLEDELQTKLFLRSARGVRLTKYGEVLFDSLGKTRNYWRETLQREMLKADEVPQEMTIGFHPSIAASCLSQFFPILQKKFPETEIKFQFAPSLEVNRRVVRFEIDLGIIANPVKNADLVAKRVSKEHISLWSSRATYKPTLLFNPETIDIHKLLKKFGSYQKIAIADYEVIAAMTKSTDYLGVLPNPIAERYSLIQQFSRLKEVDVAVVWRKDNFLHSRKRALVESIVESLKSTV